MSVSTTPPGPILLDGDLDPSRFAHLASAAATSGPPTLARLVHRARAIATQPDQWRHLVRFDPGERWRLRLHHDSHHEAWLMSWLPGQRTGLHHHGDSASVIAVAFGELQEHTPAPDGYSVLVHSIGVEHVRIWGARRVREIVNTADTPAVSVHIYAPPLPILG